jgi:hypothetical protein
MSILSILPLDVLQTIWNEWIDHVTDFVHVDTALCNRDLREMIHSIPKCLSHFDFDQSSMLTFFQWKKRVSVYLYTLVLRTLSTSIEKDRGKIYWEDIIELRNLHFDLSGSKHMMHFFDIANVLQSLPHLKALKVRAEIFNELSFSIGDNHCTHSLSSLDISQCQIQPLICQRLLSWLPITCHALKELVLVECIGISGPMLLQFLPNFLHLQSLTFISSSSVTRRTNEKTESNKPFHANPTSSTLPTLRTLHLQHCSSSLVRHFLTLAPQLHSVTVEQMTDRSEVSMLYPLLGRLLVTTCVVLAVDDWCDDGLFVSIVDACNASKERVGWRNRQSSCLLKNLSLSNGWRLTDTTMYALIHHFPAIESILLHNLQRVSTTTFQQFILDCPCFAQLHTLQLQNFPACSDRELLDCVSRCRNLTALRIDLLMQRNQFINPTVFLQQLAHIEHLSSLQHFRLTGVIYKEYDEWTVEELLTTTQDVIVNWKFVNLKELYLDGILITRSLFRHSLLMSQSLSNVTIQSFFKIPTKLKEEVMLLMSEEYMDETFCFTAVSRGEIVNAALEATETLLLKTSK